LIASQAIIGVIIWMALGQTGFQGNFWTRAATAALPFLLFPIMFIWKFILVPPGLAREQGDRLESAVKETNSLREHLKPRLRCVFDPTDEICVMEPRARLEEKMFTMRVTADGVGQIAACTAKLTSVTRPDGTTVPLEVNIPFGPSERNGLRPKDVVCGDKNYVDVLNVMINNHIRVMTDGWPSHVDIDELFSDIGSYVIGFRMVSPDAPSVERTLELRWTRDWSTTTMAQL
jgi:hypothetical protein